MVFNFFEPQARYITKEEVHGVQVTKLLNLFNFSDYADFMKTRKECVSLLETRNIPDCFIDKSTNIRKDIKEGYFDFLHNLRWLGVIEEHAGSRMEAFNMYALEMIDTKKETEHTYPTLVSRFLNVYLGRYSNIAAIGEAVEKSIKTGFPDIGGVSIEDLFTGDLKACIKKYIINEISYNNPRYRTKVWEELGTPILAALGRDVELLFKKGHAFIYSDDIIFY